jgi:hypothetical protein
MITGMRISCFFCGREDDVRDSDDAIARGWYTHTLQTTYVSFDESTTEPNSMGFVCGACAAALPTDSSKGRR